MGLAVGSIVEGVVTGITKFGAFVELPGGVTGLVHISEVADAYVKVVNDYLKESDNVTVKVVNFDEKGKIGLAIKQARPKPVVPSRNVKNDIPFEDKLAKFLKDSNEKLTALKRHQEGKKSGR